METGGRILVDKIENPSSGGLKVQDAVFIWYAERIKGFFQPEGFCLW